MVGHKVVNTIKRLAFQIECREYLLILEVESMAMTVRLNSTCDNVLFPTVKFYFVF